MKSAVLAVTAGFYVPLVADWCEPDLGLQQAAVALGGVPGVSHPFFWNMIVRAVGRNISSLGTVSMVSAFACTLLIAISSGMLVSASLRAFRKRVSLSDEESDEIGRRAEFLTALSFVLTPGFFHAATHVGPLHFLLIPFLAGLAFLMRMVTAEEATLFRRLGFGAAAGVFLVYALCEMALSRRLLQLERPAFIAFSAVGILPLVILSHALRRRIFRSQKPLVLFFTGWSLVVVGCGIASLLSVERGCAASRVIGHVIADAGSREAIVSDGLFDSMFYFMLPDDRRLILLSRDGDPEYGKGLSAWMRDRHGDRPDLFFAAELGPRTLLDEWAVRDRQSLSDAVLMPAFYFPTLEKWREGYAELAGPGARDRFAVPLRSLLASCGNCLGCRFLETGEQARAWATFWEVVNCVDPCNHPALVNLFGMLERGYAASPQETRRLARLRDAVQSESGTSDRQLKTAQAGGQLFAVSTAGVARVRKRQVEPARAAPSPYLREFIRKVSATPQTREDALRAREAIRNGLKSGLVQADRIGTQLLTLDCWLSDWESAETDAIDILRNDRGHAKANNVMGTLACSRGDYRAAEHYLRTALSVGEDEQGALAKDLAFALTSLGRADEAEAYARKAVAAQPEDWSVRETLAFVLIRRGKADEGERELCQAIHGSKEAGEIARASIRFSLDGAWLYKLRGEHEKMEARLRILAERGDLTDAQRHEIEEIRR